MYPSFLAYLHQTYLSNPDRGDCCTAARLLIDIADAESGLSDSSAALSTKLLRRQF